MDYFYKHIRGGNLEILTVAGLSGSGKTTVLQVLSEQNYMIIEGVSAKALYQIVNILNEDEKANKKLCVAINYADYDSFNEMIEVINQLDEKYTVKRIFLHANSHVLLNRFKELRKLHPMQRIHDNLSLEESISKEILGLHVYKEQTDFLINTSETSVVDLRNIVLTGLKRDQVFMINVLSFGFKYGSLSEADFIFDVRFLPNPYYIAELRYKTGLDDSVYDYVFSFKEAEDYYKSVEKLVEIAIAGLKKERRITTTIAFACTGGKHRSVAFARRLGQHLEDLDYSVRINHVEQKRANW